MTKSTTHYLSIYIAERNAYLKFAKSQPHLRTQYAKAMAIYLVRRLLWSFGFFPIFIAFWLPLVLARFNPVAMVSNLLPVMEQFVNANPEIQATTIDTILISWLSIGFLFTVFDFILTPFKSPIEHATDIYMQAWELHQKNRDNISKDV